MSHKAAEDASTVSTSAEIASSADQELGSYADNVSLLEHAVKPGDIVIHTGSAVILGRLPKGSAVLAGQDVTVWGSVPSDETQVQVGSPKSAGLTSVNDCSTGASSENGTCATKQPLPIAISIAGVMMTPRVEISREAAAKGREVDATTQVLTGPGNEIEVVSSNGTLGRGSDPRDPRNSPVIAASLATGAYITLIGFALMLAPIMTFGLLFDPSKIASGWIRVFGVLCVTFGSYYLGSAYWDRLRSRNGFYKATVAGRVFLAAALAGICAIKELPLSLLILAAINLIGAVSMWLAIAKDGSNSPASPNPAPQ